MKQIKKYFRNEEYDSLKGKLKSYSALATSFVVLAPLSNDVFAQCPTDVDPDAVINSGTFPIDFDGDGIIDLSLGNFNTGSTNPYLAFYGSAFSTLFATSTFTPPYFFFTGAGYLLNYYTFTNNGFTVNSAYANVPGGNGLLGFAIVSSPLANGDAICSTATFNFGNQSANYFFSTFTFYSLFTVTSYYFAQYAYNTINATYSLFNTTFPIGSNVLATGGISTASFGVGNFNNTVQYIGVEFDIGGNTHYGWVELQIDPTTSQIALLSYGYNPIAGECIPAGQCVNSCAPDNGTPSLVSP